MTPETSLYEFAKQGFSRFPDKVALWFYGRAVSFQELFCRVDATAVQLHRSGIKKGMVVTIHLPNSPQLVTAIYAVAKLGAICNMVHALTPAHSVQEMMTFTESDFLFTYLADCDGIAKNTVVLDVMPNAEHQTKALEWKSLDFNEIFLWEKEEVAEIPEQKLLSDACAVYLHSSGSTGRPKTIMLSHSALNHCVKNTADFFEDEISEYVSLGVLPAFHGFGLAMDVHRNISFGSTLVQMLRWDTNLAVQLIKKLKISLMAGVPTMYYALLQHPEFCGEEISCLKKCYVGGDNVKPELIKAFDDRLDGEHHMFVGYGLTEATTTDMVNTYLHYKAGSSGYPTHGTVAAVIDENGSISYEGEGELIISSQTLMIGYLNDRESTEKTLFHAEDRLWTRTGDYVRIDEDGFVFFKERLKNIIIHNSYNIYPGLVEDVIRSVDGVKEVCVVGVDDPELCTQNVRAVIISDKKTSDEALCDLVKKKCMEMLPRYSVPNEILMASEFPLNGIGKVDRIKLGSAYAQQIVR